MGNILHYVLIAYVQSWSIIGRFNCSMSLMQPNGAQSCGFSASEALYDLSFSPTRLSHGAQSRENLILIPPFLFLL